MTPYRRAPDRGSPIIVDRRPHVSAGVWFVRLVLIAFGTFAFLAFFQCERSVLVCTRSGNSCELAVRTGPEIVTRTVRFPLSSLKRAGHEGVRLYRRGSLMALALEIDGKVQFVYHGAPRVNDEWVAEVNAYLADRTRDHLELRDGRTWPFVIWVSLLGLVFVALRRKRLRFVFNARRGVLRIEAREMGTRSEEIPLDQISCAQVLEGTDDEEGASTTVLLLANGSRQQVTMYSYDGADEAQLVAELNEAMSTAKDKRSVA